MTILSEVSNLNVGFVQWAEHYFLENKSNLDSFIFKNDAMKSLSDFTKQNHWTTQRFNKLLRSWANNNGFELNPVDTQNLIGRIVRIKEGRIGECIYMRSPGKEIKDTFKL